MFVDLITFVISFVFISGFGAWFTFGVGFTFGNLYAKFDVKCGLEFVNNSISFNKVFGKLITYYNVFSDFQPNTTYCPPMIVSDSQIV